jgi:hypothetical protein
MVLIDYGGTTSGEHNQYQEVEYGICGGLL